MSFTIFPLWATLLLAAGAAAVPVLVHLLHRRRVRPILWGAMQFLRESPLQKKRRKKVEHWLLLALRVAAAVAVVLLVAWPEPNRAAIVLGGAGGTDVAFVIDHSLSTGRAAGGSTVFRKAVDAVEQFATAGALKAADTATIILAEHAPRRLTPLPDLPADLPQLVADLKALPPGGSDASIPDAVAAAREVLARGRNARKVVVVLSDRQRTSWKPEDAAAWDAAVGRRGGDSTTPVSVYELPVLPDAGAANVAVADLAVAPAVVSPARPAVVTATVTNTGPVAAAAAQTAVLSVAGRKVTSQPVAALGPGESKAIRFEHSFAAPGSTWAEVRLDAADALEADNAAAVAVAVREALPVLVIDGRLANVTSGAAADAFPNSRFLVAAMLSDAAAADAPALAKPTVVGLTDRRLTDSAGGLKFDDYAAVVVNDAPRLPPALLDRLADYARAGHGVWFLLGRSTETGFVRAGLSQAGLIDLEVRGQQSLENPPPVVVSDPTSPMVAPLVAGGRNPFAGASTFRWWAVRPRGGDAAAALATAGGDPLVLDRPLGSNGGRVVVWCVPADKTWTNWPATTAFAPLVNLTLYHLAAGRAGGADNRRLEAGQPLVWTGPPSPAAANVTITRPDGSKADRRPVVRDGRQVVAYAETFLPGRYELTFDPPAVSGPVYFGVGLDRRELDPAPLTPADLAWLTSPAHPYLAGYIDPARGLTLAPGGPADDPGRLWRWLAVVVVATLVGETALTYRHARSVRSAGEGEGVRVAKEGRAIAFRS